MTNFYDKNLKYKIESFYDPCYRTGDFYKVNYLNRGYHFGNKAELNLTDDYIHNLLERKDVEESFEYSDTLVSIFNRSEGKVIYFVDSGGNELKLVPYKMEIFVNGNKTFWFKTEDNRLIVYSQNCFLIGIPKYSKIEPDSDYSDYECPDGYGLQLVSYSFVENYKEKQKVVNSLNYKEDDVLSEEEKELVEKRCIEPLYKCEEYR